MEPWLDSLSEDWNSEPQLSSPASSLSNIRRSGTQSLKGSQSRIPYLSQSVRGDPTGSFLKPRSSRGIAKAERGAALSERSASSLNLPSSPRDGAQKSYVSSLPRRTSSAFSASQSSVQHHSLNSTSKVQEIPEWKRRLVKGQDVGSDTYDLFSPSKLEGIFAEPASNQDDVANQSSLVENNSKLWGSLSVGQFSSTNHQYQSLRTSRSRAPAMEALHEVNEEDEEPVQLVDTRRKERIDDDMSAISSDLAREGSLKGLVRRRVGDLETMPERYTSDKRAVSGAMDPRWRTFSGQQEMQNESISPVTISAKNTIRERAVRDFVEVDSNALRQMLMDESVGRPSSRSSDREVSYLGSMDEQNQLPNAMPELTSHSLPEDLSMGTQDWLSNGAVTNTKGGSTFHEASFIRHKDGSVGRPSEVVREKLDVLHSSPPPYNSVQPDLDQSNLSMQLPELPSDDSVVRHSPSPTRASSGQSPLKLFGNRDTYTNNKLMKILSHYGQDASTHDGSTELNNNNEPGADSQSGLRMSRFGNGELDSFHFEKQTSHSRPNMPNPESNSRFSAGTEHREAGKQTKIFALEQNITVQSEDNQKRLPSSPAKERTPKRRRTLLQDEVSVQGVGIEIKVDQIVDSSSAVAGRKRKDAKPGESGAQANPKVLASRNILHPRSGSRKSSTHSHPEPVPSSLEHELATPVPALTEALAAELESFAKGVSEAHHDSRKPSLATKDYMEEANKVMEFIRARGKPKSKLSGIQEPTEASELNSDEILDLEIDDDSTKESFSRPPSRERPLRPREDRRIAKHNPQVASQLKKYQESDDLELLASTSVAGIFTLAEAARVPIPEDQESSPPYMRILNPRGRKEDDHAQSPSRENSMHQSSIGSTKRTFATNSSHSSGQKGVISHGTVSIPDNVGTMTFDREKRTWIKKKVTDHLTSMAKLDHAPLSLKDTTLDEDPFHGIPDLSIDENREAVVRETSRPTSGDPEHTSALTLDKNATSGLDRPHSMPKQVQPEPFPLVEDAPTQDLSGEGITTGGTRNQPYSAAHKSPTRYEISKHEDRLSKGLRSEEPDPLEAVKKQPRAVTIAFSSPIVSHIGYPNSLSVLDDDLDNDDVFLPPEDSDYEDYIPTPKSTSGAQEMRQPQMEWETSQQGTVNRRSATTDIIRRPVSRIEEVDEDVPENDGLSLVQVQRPRSDTETPLQRTSRALQPASGYRGSSILCLTPLSEFTMHQADKVASADESFVAARPHPKALLQAHGTLALSKDELVKAITDATVDEPFWEQLRQLDLSGSKLVSLNALKEYCPMLEELKLQTNSITQLTGLPASLRRLDASLNLLNNFTSWVHLQNLQFIDVSHNQLESLEAFGPLVHLRHLRARGNKIRSIEGIVELGGLVSLDLGFNHIVQVDFADSDLPHLEKIDLSNNKLTSAQNLHCLPRLEMLNLMKNSLTSVFGTNPLINLKTLCIGHNELESLDLAILPNVETLDIDNNALRSIPGLSMARNLRTLSAREQKHSFDIANIILRTPNECSELYLSSNVLANGQLALPEYPHYNLRYLELAECGLRALPRAFGDYFPNCRKLNLNFNALSSLSQIVGCIKAEEVLLVGNRIDRLRRSCLALSRLPLLRKVDIRDNPLTVGFYSPSKTVDAASGTYCLPAGCAKSDVKWLHVLDEVTAMKRRTMELLLADQCKHLSFLNGLSFDRTYVTRSDPLWASLTSIGVLARHIGKLPDKDVITELPETGKTGMSVSTVLEHVTDGDGHGMTGRMQLSRVIV